VPGKCSGGRPAWKLSRPAWGRGVALSSRAVSPRGLPGPVGVPADSAAPWLPATLEVENQGASSRLPGSLDRVPAAGAGCGRFPEPGASSVQPRAASSFSLLEQQLWGQGLSPRHAPGGMERGCDAALGAPGVGMFRVRTSGEAALGGQGGTELAMDDDLMASCSVQWSLGPRGNRLERKGVRGRRSARGEGGWGCEHGQRLRFTRYLCVVINEVW